MLQNLISVAGQVATLFIMMAAGFALVKLGKFTKGTLSQLSFFLLYVVGPCLMIDSFQVASSPELLQDLGVGALVTVGLYTIYILISLVFFRRQGPDQRDVLRFGVVYGNCGFMGLPLLQSILGPQALIYGALALGIFNVSTWSHGVATMGGRHALSIRNALINPGILGLAIGLLLFIPQIELPSPVGNAVSFVAGCNTPVAMLVIGGQMAGANLSQVIRRPILYISAAIKLMLIPAVAAIILLPLRLSPMFYCTSVILAATPTAGITSMFAQRFERDTATAAQSISLSTLLCILTLPVFAVLAKELSGF